MLHGGRHVSAGLAWCAATVEGSGPARVARRGMRKRRTRRRRWRSGEGLLPRQGARECGQENWQANDWQANQEPATHSPAKHSPATHSPASHSPASHSPASHSPASHSPASHSPAQHRFLNRFRWSTSAAPARKRGALPSGRQTRLLSARRSLRMIPRLCRARGDSIRSI